MSAVVIRNSREGGDPVTPPLRDDGALYLYCMYFDGFKYAAFADDPLDLLDALIPGYSGMDEQQQQIAKITYAIGAQRAVQAQIVADLDPEAWNALTSEEQTVLIAPRFQQPSVDFWNPPVPLVLVDTGYAPYTNLDRPISGIADVANPPNIIWLQPRDDWDFLNSLSSAGFIALHDAADR